MGDYRVGQATIGIMFFTNSTGFALAVLPWVRAPLA
jgi:hypothetical protein